MTRAGSVTIDSGGTLLFTDEAQELVAGVITVRGVITGVRVQVSAHRVFVEDGGRIHSDGTSTAATGRGQANDIGASHGGVAQQSTASAYGSLAQVGAAVVRTHVAAACSSVRGWCH